MNIDISEFSLLSRNLMQWSETLLCTVDVQGLHGKTGCRKTRSLRAWTPYTTATLKHSNICEHRMVL